MFSRGSRIITIKCAAPLSTYYVGHRSLPRSSSWCGDIKPPAVRDSPQQNITSPCKSRLQLSYDTTTPYVLNACRAADAHLSNGAWRGTCISCGRVIRKRIKKHFRAV